MRNIFGIICCLILSACTTTPHPPPCVQGQVVEIVPATDYQAPGACGPGKVAVYGPVFQATPFGGPVVRASDEPVACVSVPAGHEGRCW